MSIWQREQAYRRRLYYLTPVAAVLMTLLFITSDRIPYREIEQQVGWKGEMRLLPEITIIPDNQETSSEERLRRLNTMTSVNLDLDEVKNERDSSDKDSEERTEEEEPNIPEFDVYDVRTVQAAREVPYSQDYVILRMVDPTYPPKELEAGMEGSVTVELFINADGRVEKATVLSAAGSRSFQESSLEAVRQFVFQPPVIDGESKPMWIKFLIKFRIFS